MSVVTLLLQPRVIPLVTGDGELQVPFEQTPEPPLHWLPTLLP